MGDADLKLLEALEKIDFELNLEWSGGVTKDPVKAGYSDAEIVELTSIPYEVITDN